MEDSGGPGLGVSFEIDTLGSFGAIDQLENSMDRATAQIVSDAAKIEKATGGMVNLAGANAQVTTFGNASTKALRDTAREQANAERSGERMAAQLTRQAETFGLNASEIRRMRAEMAAARAEAAGMTELAGRIRAASANLTALETANIRSAGGAGRNTAALSQLSFQINDVATMAALGAPPLQIFASQAGQVFQVFQTAEGGAGAFGKQLSAMALRFSPLIIAATAAGYVLNQYSDRINDATENDGFIQSLRLTDEELKKVGNTGVTMGDTLLGTFDVIAGALWDTIGPAVTDAQASFEEWFWESDRQGRESMNNQIANFVGGFNVIKSVWGQLPAVMGDLFFQAVNSGVSAINSLIASAVNGVNGFIAQANRILPESLQIAQLAAPQIAQVENAFAGAAKRMAATARAERAKANRDYLGEFGSAVSDAAVERRNSRIRSNLGERDKDKPDRGTRERLSAEEKAYQAALKAAESYIAAQEKETGRIGKSAKDIRLMEDALQRAAAPLDTLKQRIDEVAAAREKAFSTEAAKNFDTKVLGPLRDELALYGLVGPARDAAALALEKQKFITENMDDGIAVATERWERYFAIKSQLIEKDVGAEREKARIDAINEGLQHQLRLLDILVANVDQAGQKLAEAFGPAGEALSGLSFSFSSFISNQAQMTAALEEQLMAARKLGTEEERTRASRRATAEFTARSANLEIGLYGDMASAAKGFFAEKSAGYRAIMAAEKVFRAFEFAMSIRSMLQDASETISSVANSGARAAAAGAEGIATQSKLPFPFNIAAMAATGAALIAAGIAVLGSGSGGGSASAPTNEGKGTVLGDSDAQSQSIKRSLDALKEVDLLMLNSSREMAASLRSIDRQIGGVASQILRAGDVSANGGITEGFKPNLIGSVLGAIPLVGGLLKSLFGSTTTVTGSGIFGRPQTLGSIVNGGFDASYYSDIQKKSKFLGITTSTKNSTQYTGADAALEGQFTLILSEFSKAIAAAAGPLGTATSEVERRLNGFVVDIGKIELKGLTGEQVQEKLTAVFGAAADRMAQTAFPGIERFQKAGEGLFETAVRVASTVEQVTASLDLLGGATAALSIDAKVALANQFDSIGDLSGAAQSYFDRFFTAQEQAAARAKQFDGVFASLGLTMPTTLAGFRALVEAQDLTSAAGQKTFATLLQLAPAFADLQSALTGARSAAEILSERTDLERKQLEMQGNTAAIRALDLAKLDPTNRALQEQIWALQDAQEAARAADDLRKAWTDVGTSIADEVRRIRGLTGSEAGGSFAAAMGQFNATTALARGGDLDAAKALPGLSQALLKLAADNATSRQELDRVQAQTASSLEQTMRLIVALNGGAAPQSAGALIAQIGATQSQPASSANDNATSSLRDELAGLREEVVQLRRENMAGHAATAANTGGVKKHLDNLTADSGGVAISTVAA